MGFTDISGIQRDWIDEAYAQPRKKGDDRWRNSDYDDARSRRFVEWRISEHRKFDAWLENSTEAAGAKKIADIFGKQADWIEDIENEDKAMGKYIEDMSKDYSMRSAIFVCRACKLVFDHEDLVGKAVAFLCDKGEIGLSQKLAHLNDNARALQVDYGGFSFFGSLSYVGQLRSNFSSFETEMVGAYAREYIVSQAQPLKYLREFPRMVLGLGEEWRETVEDYERLIVAFEPLSVERFGAVADVQKALRIHGADFAQGFDAFASELDGMRPAIPLMPKTGGPIPGLR